MISLKVVRCLIESGYNKADVMQAVNATETNGSAELDGWVIRYDEYGEMIILSPFYCGIYPDDYSSHVDLQKVITYRYSCRRHRWYYFSNARYRDLPAILDRIQQNITDPFILCECPAGDYPRRKKQVEELGYTIHRSNISACDSDTCSCYFLIAPPTPKQEELLIAPDGQVLFFPA